MAEEVGVIGFGKWVERQILKAQAEGKLDKLEGAGKPLPERPEEAYVSAEDSAGMRIMAEAGVVPEEFRHQKDADAIRAAWQAETDEVRKKALMADLARAELKRDIAREARRKFLR